MIHTLTQHFLNENRSRTERRSVFAETIEEHPLTSHGNYNVPGHEGFSVDVICDHECPYCDSFVLTLFDHGGPILMTVAAIRETKYAWMELEGFARVRLSRKIHMPRTYPLFCVLDLEADTPLWAEDFTLCLTWAGLESFQ